VVNLVDMNKMQCDEDKIEYIQGKTQAPPQTIRLSKPTLNLYVDLVALFSTRLKSSLIILSLTIVLLRHEDK
jgi:hypothetical protein